MELAIHTTQETKVALLYPLFKLLILKIAHLSRPSFPKGPQHNANTHQWMWQGTHNTNFILSLGVCQASLPFYSIPFHICNLSRLSSQSPVFITPSSSRTSKAAHCFIISSGFQGFPEPGPFWRQWVVAEKGCVWELRRPMIQCQLWHLCGLELATSYFLDSVQLSVKWRYTPYLIGSLGIYCL